MNNNSGRNLKGNKYVWIILISALIILSLFKRTCNHSLPESTKYKKQRNIDHRQKDFRHNTVYYTKHAKCRMRCRHIDQSEVKEILEEGEINYSKSDVNASKCPKYAVEGITHDRQRVRIIVGDCSSQASIITVIDLEHDYSCNCPGDKEE